MLPFCLTESQTEEHGHVGGALTCVDAAWDDRSLFSSTGGVPVTPTNLYGVTLQVTTSPFFYSVLAEVKALGHTDSAASGNSCSVFLQICVY